MQILLMSLLIPPRALVRKIRRRLVVASGRPFPLSERKRFLSARVSESKAACTASGRNGLLGPGR